MAFILQQNGKRALPLIDLTPMVDLGFLLITFFMLTTTMSRPKALHIQMPFKPAPAENPTIFVASAAITLLPAAHHQLYYYEGAWSDTMVLQYVSLNKPGALRNILLAKQKRIAAAPREIERHLQVLIKPTAGARLDDVIQTLDEMQLLQITQFALTDISNEEAEKVKE